jgi:uncharacterized protein (TIGR03067 family)
MNTSSFVFMRIACLILILTASQCYAEDRRVEGVVQSVDADRSSITLTTKSGGKEQDEAFDVVKKAKVTINGKAASLADVRRGQKATVVVNTDLDVATRIDASGERTPDPELVVIKELPNQEAYQSAPWLSEDGLTLYWKCPPPGEKEQWIWMARRRSPDDLFENAKKLVPGNDPALTADGLELILLAQGSLLSATRSSAAAAFQRPQRIFDRQGNRLLASPCLAPDGLTLYADLIDFDTKSVALQKYTRPSRRAKWGDPQTVRFSGVGESKLRFFHMTGDGRYAFCTMQSGDWESSPMAVFRSGAEEGGFSSPRIIVVGGRDVIGKFPRYVAATHELFFARMRQDSKQDELCVIRNFDPQSHSRELRPAANSPGGSGDPGSKAQPGNAEATKKALDALQGEWLTIAEETNGNSASKNDVKQINRRIVIKGKSLTMTRVMGGNSGTYSGTFEIDAPSKKFDWKGKGPRGSQVELRGIIEIDGNRLKICYKYVKDDNTTRPTAFKTDKDAGTNFIFLTLKRDED